MVRTVDYRLTRRCRTSDVLGVPPAPAVVAGWGQGWPALIPGSGRGTHPADFNEATPLFPDDLVPPFTFFLPQNQLLRGRGGLPCTGLPRVARIGRADPHDRRTNRGSKAFVRIDVAKLNVIAIAESGLTGEIR
ncbi:hypothetical protein IE4803_PB00117 (plasmid) [Rhizobium etli bv. phaseoli str. IE4803]|nr:hypothetical protein IE4803_PB00117 [Rhizobium etli bv. phaseoli str. IE4803]